MTMIITLPGSDKVGRVSGSAVLMSSVDFLGWELPVSFRSPYAGQRCEPYIISLQHGRNVCCAGRNAQEISPSTCETCIVNCNIRFALSSAIYVVFHSVNPKRLARI